MKFHEIREKIRESGGDLQKEISWEWALFNDEATARKIFHEINEHCDTRGFHGATETSRAGFRFRDW